MTHAMISEEKYLAATARGEQFRRDNPAATAARFDAASGRLVIDFENGSTLMVPARSLQGLSDATDEQLAAVELHHDYYLHWEELDADFQVTSLLKGVFGTAKFMEAARLGGRSRSPAKVAASRANGAKGGRPRKDAPA